MGKGKKRGQAKPANLASDCAMCTNPATQSCPSCHCNNLYCSETCREADKDLHNLLCKTRPSFERPPTRSSRRAIVFLASGELKFTWETTKMETEPDGTKYESPVGISRRHFGGEHVKPQSYYANALRGRRLRETITLFLNDEFLLDGSKKNLAVCKVVPGMDDGGAVWRGALVAMKGTNSWYDSSRTIPNPAPGYGHMDMGDLREVVDYLTNWKRVINGDDGRWPQHNIVRLTAVQGANFGLAAVFPTLLWVCVAVAILWYAGLDVTRIWGLTYLRAIAERLF